jgi:mannitol/fructose-specific phosphotransferase system IIA component (Ntr-type)
VKRPLSSVAVSAPIDYRAPDDGPVDVFFVTLGPQTERNTHLRLLSTLAFLVTETRLLERLRAADNDSELMAVLLASATLHTKPPSDPPGGDSDDSDQERNTV